MEHRHFPNSFRMLMDQGLDRNHLPAEQSYIHMERAVASDNENGSLDYQVGSMLRGRTHFTSHWNSESRAYVYPSSSFSMEGPHFQPAISGPSYASFPESSAPGNLYLAPENNASWVHSNHYDRCNIHENENGPLLDSTAGSGSGPFKRKNPTLSLAYERGSTSRFYGAGSSSSSSEMLQEKPTSDRQNNPSSHIRSDSLSISGQDSLRNVRSRSTLDLGANPMQTYLSSYSSRHYHSTTSSNYHGMVNLTNMNADGNAHQWNINTPSPPLHGMIRTSGTSGLSHESNQILRGCSRIHGCHYDSVSHRNLVSSSQYAHHTPHIQDSREGHDSHSHRAIPTYRTGPSFSQLGQEDTSTETYSSRYSIPSARGWRNSHRNGRSRIAVDRFQLISSMVDVHNRIGSEDITMIDHSSRYASHRNLFDHHRDMRLDVDNMSYEELLALGERIGNVSTGMSEDMISKCLNETIYSAGQNHEEGTCPICLEDYAEEEVVGTMNCGHNYHGSCIRKWLLIKNVCPICKAPALADRSKLD